MGSKVAPVTSSSQCGGDAVEDSEESGEDNDEDIDDPEFADDGACLFLIDTTLLTS